MRALLFIAYFSICCSAFAQPDFFERVYGLGRGVYIDKALNGNFIIGANTGSHPAYQGYYFLIDTNNDTVKSFSYPNSSINCIRQTTDSGFVFIGDSGASVMRQAGIVKTDSLGNVVSRNLYESSEWASWGCSIIPNYENGYIASYVDDGDLWENYLYIVKSDPDCETIDTTAVNPSTGFLLNANCTKLTTDSGVIVTSTYYLEDISVVKLNSLNNIEWTKIFYDPSATFGLSSSSIIQTHDGGYLLIGYTDSLNIASAVFGYILRMDSNGDSLWSRSFYFPGFYIQLMDVVEDSTGQFYITGELWNRTTLSQYSSLLMKTDSSGDSLWTKQFTGYGSACPNTMVLDENGLPMIIGYTEDTIANQFYIHLISTDSTGNLYTGTGVAQKSNSNIFSVSPNPFKTTISLSIKMHPDNINVTVTDLQGQTILEIKNSTDREIDLHHLNPGIYLLQVQAGDHFYNEKIVKQ